MSGMKCLEMGEKCMSDKQYHIKGWFPAFLVCAFMILGVPVIINLIYWPEIGVWTIANDP